MLAVLYALILIGLIPVTVRLAISIDPGRKVGVEINVGPLTLRPQFGQGKANIPWLRKMMSHIKPPVPVSKLPAMAAQALDIREMSVRMKLGLDDAAATALACGTLEMAVGALGEWLRRESAQKPNPIIPEIAIRVRPVFGTLTFDLKAEVIIKGRIGQYTNLAARLGLSALSAILPKHASMYKEKQISAT